MSATILNPLGWDDHGLQCVQIIADNTHGQLALLQQFNQQSQRVQLLSWYNDQ
jgi:hypothetical protein